MIYPYIKVNKKVVDFLGITEDRYQFPDGNYMLWKFDLIQLGGNNDETLRKIGGLGMTTEQVREEQRGGTPAPLPVAEDERFRAEEVSSSEYMEFSEESVGEEPSEETATEELHEETSEESSDEANEEHSEEEQSGNIEEDSNE